MFLAVIQNLLNDLKLYKYIIRLRILGEYVLLNCTEEYNVEIYFLILQTINLFYLEEI
jgi:hypothetical protein